ncbi:MAG: glycosyltransferase, partial [Planctomycetes bacterium]|nr:glycosyltransferase [Planctomycetota bacterium]
DGARCVVKSLASGSRDFALEELRWSDRPCDIPENDVALFRALLRAKRPTFSAAITCCIPGFPECQPDPNAVLNVLRCTFETDRIPPNWLPEFEKFDELWVMTEHDRVAFRQGGAPPEKIRVAPEFVDTSVFTSRGKKLPLPEELRDRFVFLSVFEWQLRKGWDVLVRAYCQEFSPSDGVGLLLKVSCGHGQSMEGVHEQVDSVLSKIRQRLSKRPDIVFWDEMLNTESFAALYRSVDAFVLPTRGEGWGRPYMEAMASGLPTIGTAGSGNAAFMTNANSFLIPAKLVDVSDEAANEIPVYRGHKWLEPDPKTLRTAMRTVVEDEARRKAVTRKAVKDIRTTFDLSNARDVIEQRLTEAEERFRSVAPPPIASSQIRVELEGELFASHSFSNINEQLAMRFIADNKLALSIRRVEHNPTHDGEVFDAYRILPSVNRPLDGGPEVTIRHAFPPNWSRPATGRWVHIQPWEFGALPLEWVAPLRDQVDEVWAPSNYVKQVYINSGIPGDKIVVTPWGIDPAVFDPKAPPVHLPTQASFVFLFVGGTISRKGFDILLDAYQKEFSRDDDVCLVVKDVGTKTFYRYGNLRDRVLQAIAESTGPEIVYIESNLSLGQIVSLYTACDCLVAPYRGEGFGLPILEAMACGVTPIVPRGGASDDFVSDDTAYLVPADVVECEHDWRLCGVATELAPKVVDVQTAMRGAFERQKATRRMGHKASEIVREQYTWDKTASLMSERLQALADRSAKPTQEPPKDATIAVAKRDASISACMLVKDQEQMLPDSLGRIRPFVDEIVVLDLSSTDRSVVVCQDYGARCYGHPGGDDYSSLRNAVIRKATKRWIFTLQPWEMINDSESEKLKPLLESIEPDVFGVSVKIVSRRPGSGEEIEREEVRLIRNHNDVFYRFRAFEEVTSSIDRLGGRIVSADITICEGLSWQEPQHWGRSPETLLASLHADLQEHSNDPSVLFNLGMTHFELGNFLHAECYLSAYLDSSSVGDRHFRQAWHHVALSHLNTQNPYGGLQTLEAALTHFPNDEPFQEMLRQIKEEFEQQ